MLIDSIGAKSANLEKISVLYYCAFQHSLNEDNGCKSPCALESGLGD